MFTVLTMGLTAVHALSWLLIAFTATTRGSTEVELNVSPHVSAECNKAVTLNCGVSVRGQPASIKFMEWSVNRQPLCRYHSKGNISHHRNTHSHFHCKYEDERLALVFHEVQPVESGRSTRFMCKLHTNRGIIHRYSQIKLQECYRSFQANWTEEGPVCTAKVHSDLQIHWAPSSVGDDQNLKPTTWEGVDELGWQTLRSHLKVNGSQSYNCSLWSPGSRKYVASTEVKPNAADTVGPVKTYLCLPALLVIALSQL